VISEERKVTILNLNSKDAVQEISSKMP